MSKYWISALQLKELAQAENGNQIFVLLHNIQRTQKLDTERTESLTKGLVSALIVFNDHYQGKPLHLQSLPLTKNQYNNFQKLQYHGLVKHGETGYWDLTFDGDAFLTKNCPVSKSVTLEDGQVIARSPQKTTYAKLMGIKTARVYPQYSDYLD